MPRFVSMKCKRRKCMFYLLLYTILFIACLYALEEYYFATVNCLPFNKPDFHSEEHSVKISLKKLFLQNHVQISNRIKGPHFERVSKDVYIYSAYIDIYEAITSPSSLCVRFIGASLTNREDFGIAESSLKCAFKDDNGTVYKFGFAAYEKVPENHNLMYSATNFYCLFHESKIWPTFAAIYEDSDNVTWIKVTSENYNAFTKSNSSLISICVRPLYNSISFVDITEFIAYYSAVGVDHFIFYHMNVSETFEIYLNSLQYFNLSVEVFNWDIPLNNDIVHEFGQLVFTQECAARSLGRFSHTIFVDLDEFIVPRQHHNMKSMLLDLDKENPKAGSYAIRMALFCNEFSKINSDSSQTKLAHNLRQRTIWSHWFRSKYILKPSKVHKIGVHYVFTYKQDAYEMRLPKSVALLHHYKYCCGMRQSWFFHLMYFTVLNDDVVMDNSLLPFYNSTINHSLMRFILNAVKMNAIQI